MVDEVGRLTGRRRRCRRLGLELEAHLEGLLHDLSLHQHRVGQEPGGVRRFGIGRPSVSQDLLEFMEDHGRKPMAGGAGTVRGMSDHRRSGVVVEFDPDRGLGTVTTSDDGVSFPFHCTVIADGTRTIDEGTEVSFVVGPGGPGRWEAFDLTPRG